MALTPSRWIAIAATGFLLAAVVIVDDVETLEWRRSKRDQLTGRLYVAETQLRRAADQLRVLQLRDSILPIASKGSASSFLVDGAFDPASRALIDSVIVAARSERAMAARIPASVFFVLDTVAEVRGQNRHAGARGALAIDYVLPSDSTRRCVVIARVRMPAMDRLVGAELRSSISRERLLGPCAFLEHFGTPGKSIRGWLDVRGWQFAQRSAWEEPPAPWLDGSPDSTYRARIDLEFVMSSSGRACAGGKDPACLDALLSRSAVTGRQSPMTLSAGVLSSGYYNPFVHGDNGWLTRSWALGSREWTLLSDMVRSMGPERFERFWSSELPPEQAFQAAAGTSLAGWTRAWIETTYHPQATGPTLPAGATGFAALVLIPAVGLTLFAARRRQIG
jgi:hypothetical protein